MLKAIIFDLGKVVFDLSFDKVFRSWAVSSGKSYEDIKNSFVFDNTFDRFERNDMSPAQFREEVSAKLGISISDADFDRGWCDLYLDPYEGIDALLSELKHSYRLVALTNTNAIHNNVWRSRYAAQLQYFEKIFASHELGCRKPEAAIYETVLNYLGLEPGETLFLDDNPDNTNGADRLGIKTILVSSFGQMKAGLNNAGTAG